MKKIILTVIATLFISATSVQAVTNCAAMELTLVGSGGVWLKNVSGAACGGIANNTSQYFTFTPAKVDRQLAIALTAFSLDKDVWAQVLGDTKGSILNVISIKK